jgi:hypothetical protein
MFNVQFSNEQSEKCIGINYELSPRIVIIDPTPNGSRFVLSYEDLLIFQADITLVIFLNLPFYI